MAGINDRLNNALGITPQATTTVKPTTQPQATGSINSRLNTALSQPTPTITQPVQVKAEEGGFLSKAKNYISGLFKKPEVTSPSADLLSNLNKPLISTPTIIDLGTDKVSGASSTIIPGQEKELEKIPGRIVKDVGVGLLSTTKSLSDFVKWRTEVDKGPEFSRKAIGSVAQSASNKLEEWSKQIAPENPTLADQIVQGFGSSIPFFVPGYGLSSLASGVLKVSPFLASVIGAGGMTALESAVESGAVYEENIDAGKSVKQADEQATKDFLANIVINMITDKLGFLSDTAKGKIKKIIVSGSMEALQEMAQQVTSNVTTDKKYDEGVWESGLIGSIVGTGMTAGFVQLDPETQQAVDLIIKKDQVSQGKAPEGNFTPQEAIDTVVGTKLQDTPEGKEIIKMAFKAQDEGTNVEIKKEGEKTVVSTATATQETPATEMTSTQKADQEIAEAKKTIEDSKKIMEENPGRRSEMERNIRETQDWLKTKGVTEEVRTESVATTEERAKLQADRDLQKTTQPKFEIGQKVLDDNGKTFIVKESYIENGKWKYGAYTPGKKSSPAHQFRISESDLTGVWSVSAKGKVTPSTESVATASDVLERQIGKTFEVVKPVSGLWESKGNILHIRPLRPNIGFASKLSQNNIVESVQEAGGNNVYKVVLKKSEVPTQKPTPKPKATSKPAPVQKEKVLSTDKVFDTLIPKKTTLPILKFAKVEGGKMMISNLDYFAVINTELADGVYQNVGKDMVQVKNQDLNDFPELPEGDFKEQTTIPNEDFKNTLEMASQSLSKDDTRPVLASYKLESVDGKLRVITTDGYKLTIKNTKAKMVEGKPFNINGLEGKLNKFIQVLNGNITISHDAKNRNVKIAGSNGYITVGEIEGTFPPYQQILRTNTEAIGYSREKMKGALKELKPYIKYNPLQLEVTIDREGKQIILKSKTLSDSPVGETTKEISIPITKISEDILQKPIVEGTVLMPIKVEGWTAETEGKDHFTLNPKYLDEVLDSLEGNDQYLYSSQEALKPIQFLDRIVKSEDPSVAPKSSLPKVPKGALASEGGMAMGDFEAVPFEKSEASNYKLFEKVNELIQKYAERIGEGYLPKGSAGVYYPDSKNIRINGMNNLSVATHEIAHFLDYKYKITERIREVVGTTSDGKPMYDRSTAPLRKEITQIYVDYYPGGKKTHKLRKRVEEGLATLLQKYSEQPTTIRQKYPNLVTEFLSENGKFYEPVIGDILTDIKQFIQEYQGLAPLDKIGARVTSDNVVYDKKSFMSVGDKLRETLADQLYPIEKLAKLTGNEMTANDPSLHMRQYNAISSIIANNFASKRGYYRYKSGEGFQKTLDYNWKTLVDTLAKDKLADSFGHYLVARASYYDYLELDKLKQDFKEKVQIIKTLKEQGVDPKEMIDEIQEAEQAKKAFQDQERMLVKDGITRAEAQEAYTSNQTRFAKFEQMYDDLVREDLKLLNEREVGMMNETQFEELSSRRGYASRKRQMFDQIVGETEVPANITRVGKTKISSMLKRTGSSRTIVNPVVSSLTNHAEIVKKAYRQVVYNKINNLASKLPELAQTQQIIRVKRQDGSFSYPQEKDPNIIISRRNGKREAVLWDNYVKTVIDNNLNPDNYGSFERILLASSRLFSKGTTQTFPMFALTNWLGDQITGVANTTNNYIPIYSSLRELSKAVSDKTSLEAKYFQEYLVLGGERQTFAGWQDMSAKELQEAIRNERTGIVKVIDLLNKGVDIVSIPSKWSEISTRATEYVKSRKAGNNQVVALEQAGRVTAPFHHVGKWGGTFGKTAIKTIPFFNPTIQVLDQTLRQVTTSPKTRQRVLFTFIAMTAGVIASFGLMGDASDEQKRIFRDLEAEELVKYIWLPHPNGKSLIKIKVQDYGIIGNLVNMALANSMYNANYTARDFISGATQILPAQFNITEPVKAFLSWIPQFIKPFLEVSLGVKTFPNVMPIENQYLQGLPVGQRFNEGTSEMAKWLGKTFDLSPIKIDHLLQGYLGSSVGFLTLKPSAYDVFSKVTRQEYFTSGRTLRGYYDLKDKVEQDYKSAKEGLTTPSQKEIEWLRTSKDRINMIDKYLKAYRELDIEANPEKAEQYRQEIIKRINEFKPLQSKVIENIKTELAKMNPINPPSAMAIEDNKEKSKVWDLSKTGDGDGRIVFFPDEDYVAVRSNKGVGTNRMLEKNIGTIQEITKIARKFNVPASLMVDIALQESELNPKAKAEGTISGLFQMSEGTYKMVQDAGVVPKGSSKDDLQNNITATAYLISKGYLGYWDAGLNKKTGEHYHTKWSRYYQPEELEAFQTKSRLK